MTNLLDTSINKNYYEYSKILYNHSKLHYSKGNLDNSWKDETLTKKHFTFRNINQILGNIKW